MNTRAQFNQDQIVDAAVSDYCKTAEELAGVLANVRHSLAGLPDEVAALVLEARQTVVLRMTNKLANDYLNASTLLGDDSDDRPTCEACGKRADCTLLRGHEDAEGVYACPSCAMSAWDSENPKPVYSLRDEVNSGKTLHETLTAWEHDRSAFAVSVGYEVTE